MKLNKLLSIVALSGIATIAIPLVSCGNNGEGDTPTEDKILKGEFSYEVPAEMEPFVYPEDYEALPKQDIKIRQLWDTYTSNDKAGYYLACDYTSAMYTLLYQTDITINTNVELNVTTRRLSLDVEIEGADQWIKFTNVPISTTVDDDFYCWLEPIGALAESLEIFSFDDWKIQYNFEDEVEISPESSYVDIAAKWLDMSGYFATKMHYFDNVDIK